MANMFAWVFKLALPKTQTLTFENIFKNVEKETQDEFRKLSGQREEMRSRLETEAKEPALIAIEKYMPSFFGLIDAAESLPPDFSKWLRIIWSTPICARYSTSPFVYAGFRFEVTYGILHRNIANDMLLGANLQLSEFDEKSKMIANHLCQAAGVFEHIREHQLSQWKVKPDVHLPEVMDETYIALSEICIAEAQEIAVKKGILKGTSGATLAKLTIDISQKFEHAYNLVKGMVGNENVIPAFLNYMQMSTILWKTITFRLLAEDSYSKGAYGKSVAYIRAALESIPERKPDAILEAVVKGYNEERALCKMLSEKYSSENDTIYYELIPNDAPLPEAKCFMKSIPFEPPQKQDIKIIQTKGSDCILM